MVFCNGYHIKVHFYRKWRLALPKIQGKCVATTGKNGNQIYLMGPVHHETNHRWAALTERTSPGKVLIGQKLCKVNREM